MSWLSKVLNLQPKAIPTLYFKGPGEALQYAEAYLKTNMEDGSICPCIVDDVLGTIAKIKLSDGSMGLAGFPENVEYPASYIGSLCAVLLGPNLPNSPMRPMLLVAALRPVLTKKGWEIEKPFQQ